MTGLLNPSMLAYAQRTEESAMDLRATILRRSVAADGRGGQTEIFTVDPLLAETPPGSCPVRTGTPKDTTQSERAAMSGTGTNVVITATVPVRIVLALGDRMIISGVTYRVLEDLDYGSYPTANQYGMGRV